MSYKTATLTYMLMIPIYLLLRSYQLLKAQENLNADIETPEQWLDANKLSPNLVKTEYMIIASSPKLKHIDFSPLIKVAGKPIKRMLKTDYSWLITDEKLPWVDHISPLTKKISSAVAVIKNVHFLPRRTLITLYQSLVESLLRYCNTVWGIVCTISFERPEASP